MAGRVARRPHRAGYSASSCVCGLQPCLSPHCVAFDFDKFGGNLVADERSFAPYQGTPEEVSHALLKLAGLQRGETFADLGCGDGRVLLHALQRFGAARVIGFELDPAVFMLAQAHVAARLGEGSALLQRVELHCGDAREAALHGCDVVALYLLPEGHAALEPHLARQLPRGCGARVVAHGWPVPGWTATQELVTPLGARLYLYQR